VFINLLVERLMNIEGWLILQIFQQIAE